MGTRPRACARPPDASSEASLIILNAPERGMSAPRPYPELSALSLLRLERGRNWIAYDPAGPIIAGVFFETDDIPSRMK